jgi:hypothetical protein
LAGLEARCHQAADAAERARQRAAASVAAVAADTGRIRQALLTRRDADRPAAYAAAQVVLEGPGRLRPRRGQVTRAGEQLADWADRWRAHLPALPTDTNALAVLAGRPDDRPVLQAALATAARRAAKAAHPEHAALTVAVTGAVRDHADARRELEQARAWYDDRPTDPESQADLSRQLADTAGRLAASREQLAHIRARIAVLAAEPALRAQPADLLSQERTSWATARQVEEAARRSSTPSPRRSAALVVRPPEPPTRLTHRQTPVGPRYGR